MCMCGDAFFVRTLFKVSEWDINHSSLVNGFFLCCSRSCWVTHLSFSNPHGIESVSTVQLKAFINTD